ncbi:hypothetical protein GOP47_0023600 [Adiantum capillus-veneris]|uniref:Pentatricopeptide repeat-containing protein n=1 Tax=Adiantum capillus-veneris TaxID=13818 RepID=A0A9D4U4T8_ADICA|nr:hypothetical protein GOP47_0023600 [Adiantum capillus-veneris]
MYADDKILSFSEQCSASPSCVTNHLYDCVQVWKPSKQVSVQSAQAPLVQQNTRDDKKKWTADRCAEQPPPHHFSCDLQRQPPIEQYQNGLSAPCNDLLRSLCTRGYLDKALDVLADAPSFTPSISSYLFLLQTCIKSRSIAHVKEVYSHIASHNAVLQGILGDYLAMALARCGDVEGARQVANSLPHLTVFSWSAIISAYAEKGLGQEALELHHLMLDQGVYPDQHTFVSLFRACSSIPDLACGQALHAEACMKGFTLDEFVNNSLVTMYGKQGAILDAENIFKLMSGRSVVSWNAMLSAYVEQEDEEKAFQLYRQMQEEGVNSNQQTFVIALQACVLLAEKEEACLMEGMPIKVKALSIGEALHRDALSKGFALDLYVGTALSTMYGKCGAIVRAENFFGRLPHRSVISWNSMFSAFIEHGQGMKALQFYRYLHDEGVTPDELTVVFALQACCILAENAAALNVSISLQIGQALHIDACTKGFDSDVIVATALLVMYSKCGCMSDAENIFSEFSGLNIVSWSAMLTAYINCGLGQKALVLFMQMHEEGLCPCVQTLVLAIQASGTLLGNEEVSIKGNCSIRFVSLKVGHALHAYACKSGFDSDVLVSTALVSMYGKCGSVVEAEYVFRATSHPDVVTYTALFSAYVSEECPEQAIALYKEMPKQDLILDEVTLICLLQACGESGSLEVCEELYFIVVAAGYDKITSVISALAHAYGNCASMSDGQAAFDGLSEPTILPWAACIMGHAGDGNIEASLNMLEQLKLAGVIPDETIMSSALLACGHSGNTDLVLQ